MDIEEVLISHYFQRGFDHSVILLFLEKYHATEMSVRTSHNRLREYGLGRRNANSYDAEIYQAIQQELDRPGCMRGYRARVAHPSFGLRNKGSKKEFYNKLTLKEQPCEMLMH